MLVVHPRLGMSSSKNPFHRGFLQYEAQMIKHHLYNHWLILWTYELYDTLVEMYLQIADSSEVMWRALTWMKWFTSQRGSQTSQITRIWRLTCETVMSMSKAIVHDMRMPINIRVCVCVCVCVCVLHFPHCLLYYCCCASSIQFFLGTVSSKKYLSLFVPGPGAMYSSQSGVQSGLVYSPQAPQSYSLDSQLGMTGMGWWFVLQIMF